MAILTDLIVAMTADTSVNTFATGGIKYDHLPVDFDATKNWVVFGYSSNGNINTIDHINVASEYTLNVQLISPTLATLESTSDVLIDHLISYDVGNLRSITLVDDDLNIDTERVIYYKTLNFNVLYIN
jgi:hypothetical protein